MKRAMRILRHAAIAGSALVCAAVVADRVWDHWYAHLFAAVTKPSTSLLMATKGPVVCSTNGMLIVGVDRDDLPKWWQSTTWGWYCRSTMSKSGDWWRFGDSMPNRFGFFIGASARDSDILLDEPQWRLVEAPHWFIATLTAIAPACWLVGRLRRRRDRDFNRCRRCGYDLRATPDRCPECGDGPFIP